MDNIINDEDKEKGMDSQIMKIRLAMESKRYDVMVDRLE